MGKPSGTVDKSPTRLEEVRARHHNNLTKSQKKIAFIAKSRRKSLDYYSQEFQKNGRRFFFQRSMRRYLSILYYLIQITVAFQLDGQQTSLLFARKSVSLRLSPSQSVGVRYHQNARTKRQYQNPIWMSTNQEEETECSQL